jgi:predicted metal-binding membrane protein
MLDVAYAPFEFKLNGRSSSVKIGTRLAACRTPLGFLTTGWREGHTGAVIMGLRHGTYCLGCCWVLMALLFVGGVMNIVWVAAIAGLVLAEKALPRWGIWVTRASGVLLPGWGAWTVIATIT